MKWFIDKSYQIFKEQEITNCLCSAATVLGVRATDTMAF